MKWTEAQLAEFTKRVPQNGAPKPEPAPKKTKMGNKPTWADGHLFPSEKEAQCWMDLRVLEKAGEISELRKQYPLGITVNGEHICILIVDFRFKDKKGVYRYQDAKGRKGGGVQYAMFKLKQKLALASNKVVVEEI